MADIKNQGIKFSLAGVIITLGIVYIGIGTSPLNVLTGGIKR